VRVGRQHPLGVEVHQIQELDHTVVDLVLVAHPVSAPGIEELLPDGDDRVERGERRLKHHRAVRPTEAAQSFRVEGEDIEGSLPIVVPDLAFGDAGAARR
jgi:hypothetical protein